MFKKIDQYLLNNYPSLWVTRFHIFLPIGIALFFIIFLINAVIPWSPKDSMPNSAGAIMLTVIPVLVYLVYWFIFQSRYNVIKSRGKVSILQEYANFVIYMMLFFVTSFMFFAVPASNYYRVKTAVSPEDLTRDQKALDLGYSLVTGNGNFEIVEDGIYRFTQQDYIGDYYYYDYDYDYYEEPKDYENQVKTVDRENALKIINNFIVAYNKYTHSPIYKDAEDFLQMRIDEVESYAYNDYYLDDWEVQWKVGDLVHRHKSGHWFEEFEDEWFWKGILAVCAVLSMLVIIFKQTKLRQFIYAFISMCLTPLLFTIVAVILFEVIQLRGRDEEDVVAILFLLWYGIAAFFAIRGHLQKDRSNLGYVSTIYFHFFLPGLPLVLFFLLMDKNRFYGWNGDDMANLLYYTSWAVGLAGLAIFKKVYTKYYHIPSPK